MAVWLLLVLFVLLMIHNIYMNSIKSFDILSLYIQVNCLLSLLCYSCFRSYYILMFIYILWSLLYIGLSPNYCNSYFPIQGATAAKPIPNHYKTLYHTTIIPILPGTLWKIISRIIYVEITFCILIIGHHIHMLGRWWTAIFLLFDSTAEQ